MRSGPLKYLLKEEKIRREENKKMKGEASFNGLLAPFQGRKKLSPSVICCTPHITSPFHFGLTDYITLLEMSENCLNPC